MADREDVSGTQRRREEGDLRGSISRRIVQLHKEFYGRGPTKAKTYYNGDLVVVLMRGGFTAVEETLLQAGRGDSVVKQRADFQDVMFDRFREVIESETGRKVAAMMSGSHQHPDLLAEMFVLETSDVLVDEPTENGE
jgi:uncharacterized protein YbcI